MSFDEKENNEFKAMNSEINLIARPITIYVETFNHAEKCTLYVFFAIGVQHSLEMDQLIKYGQASKESSRTEASLTY